MSGLLNSALNGSSSNIQDTTGRSFTAQSAASAPVFHHIGSIQGLHNIHGNFNVPNLPTTLTSRNSTINGTPSSGQQPSGSLSSGRFVSNNLPTGLSQLSLGGPLGHSSITNRGAVSAVGNPAFSGSMNGGGSIPGIPPSSAAVGSRSAVPGMVSPMMGNTSSRITSSMGNIVGGANMGRSIGSGGGLSVGLASRLNLATNNGSGSLGAQGHNRLSMLQPGTPQVVSMLGNSYPNAGPLSQGQFGQLQAGNSLSSMGFLNDMNSSDNSALDMKDFPQLGGRPSSAGGPQGQFGSLRKPSVGSIVQQNQEFSIQNEDFPALPGFKGSNVDYAMDLHQKEQFHDNAAQQFPMGRSAEFNLGGIYSSNRPLQQQQQHATSVSSSRAPFTPANSQDLLHLNGSDMFPISHASYHSQTSGPSNIGLRQLNSSSSISGMGSYDLLMQQYHQQQQQSQFHLRQGSPLSQSYRDHNAKSMQMGQASADPFGLLGLLSVVRTNNPDLNSLSLGIDLTTLGLNLNSSENLYKTFGSPWSDKPVIGEPEYKVPECYYAQEPPTLDQGKFSKFRQETLFYIFYSMPKDEAQLYAANELCNRGWVYHKQLKSWLTRAPNVDLLAKSSTHERGSYIIFDMSSWERVRKDNFVLVYEMLEDRPTMPQR